jgi:AbrB family looped-hinge helix DNA binding protein
MPTTVTIKGQVTIPKAVRERLGIGPGSSVEFRLDEEGRVFLVKCDGTAIKSRFETLRGVADAGLSTDEIMALTRGGD